MGRKARAKSLGVWNNGLRIATWTIPARGPMELRYDPKWVESALARPLSLSLPFAIGGEPLRSEAVGNCFENLLPDNPDIKRRLARRYTAGSIDTFDLLQALGRDCVGAVQLLPEGDEPRGFDAIEGRPLSDRQIAEHLRATVAQPGAGHSPAEDDFRVSMAGAQEKTALLSHRGKWMLPAGATPSTHIIKLPLGVIGGRQRDMRTSVQNEWLCMKLLQAFGLQTAPVEIRTFADHEPVLVVARFDRQLHSSGKWYLRLPQEDFCQVFGLPPWMKYEAEGGAGVAQIAQILGGSTEPERDKRTLLSAQILFWMLAATDGHAKNFSIRLHAGGKYQLTPLYDVLSLWPLVGSGRDKIAPQDLKMAMAVSGRSRHYHHGEIQRRHFNVAAQRCGWGEDCEDIIEQLLARVEGAIGEVVAQVPPGFPQDVLDAVVSGVRSSADRLKYQPRS